MFIRCIFKRVNPRLVPAEQCGKFESTDIVEATRYAVEEVAIMFENRGRPLEGFFMAEMRGDLLQYFDIHNSVRWRCSVDVRNKFLADSPAGYGVTIAIDICKNSEQPLCIDDVTTISKVFLQDLSVKGARFKQCHFANREYKGYFVELPCPTCLRHEPKEECCFTRKFNSTWKSRSEQR